MIHFEASDPISGVASLTPDQTLAMEAADQSVSGEAIDHAGNSASTTVTGINIDKTLPAVTIHSPESRAYSNVEPLTIGWTASDTLSGVAAERSLDGGPVDNVSAVDLLLLGAGPHTVVVSAVDRADNTGRFPVSLPWRSTSTASSPRPGTCASWGGSPPRGYATASR